MKYVTCHSCGFKTYISPYSDFKGVYPCPNCGHINTNSLVYTEKPYPIRPKKEPEDDRYTIIFPDGDEIKTEKNPEDVIREHVEKYANDNDEAGSYICLIGYPPFNKYYNCDTQLLTDKWGDYEWDDDGWFDEDKKTVKLIGFKNVSDVGYDIWKARNK